MKLNALKQSILVILLGFTMRPKILLLRPKCVLKIWRYQKV